MSSSEFDEELLRKSLVRDRIAIVTGAGSGIGKGISLKFLQAGAKVFGTDLYTDRLDSLKEEARQLGVDGSHISTLVGDVTNETFVSKMVTTTVDSFGSIDILVNNAGGSLGFAGKTFLETDKKIWDATLATNLYSALFCTKNVLPLMIQRKYGRIINLGSTNGMSDSASLRDSATPYSFAKAAVIQFTRTLAWEVAKYGITVNAVSPGIVRTRVFERFPRELLEIGIKATALGRVGEPEDIANTALFLASEQGSWITGQNICASGGLVMQ